MSEVVKQAAFEDHLTDLERLIDLKLECQHPDPEAFKAIVEAKIKILAELSILTTESTTLKDIERLANLRILMLHHDIYLKPMYGRFSGFHGNATLVDDTLQRKIKALLDRKAKGSNQDPLDVVKRLTLVEAKLSEQIFSRCFPNKLAEVIKQEMAHLAECMKSPKILPKNIGNANFKTSSIHHVIDKGYFSGAPDLDSGAVNAKESIGYLKRDVHLLEAQLQKHSKTLSQLSRSLYPRPRALDTLTIEDDTDMSSVETLTPTSTLTSQCEEF